MPLPLSTNRCLTVAVLIRKGREMLRCLLLVLLLILTTTEFANSKPSLTQPTTDELAALVKLYRELHAQPELSFYEHKTAERVAAELRAVGAEVATQVGGTGVVGVLKNGTGKTLMLRCDLDALPIVEDTGLEYASSVRTKDDRGAVVGVMHACGHDIHMTNLIGVARQLAKNKSAWSGTLVCIAQPAEEKGAGAKAMLADGLFARWPRPDFALALHVSPSSAAGTVGYLPGYSQANVDSVDITVHGRGGHGAHPDATADPIVIASKLVLDLQTIVSRELDPIEPAVVTVGSIHAGTKHNIIPDDCKLQLTVRSYSPEVRKLLKQAIIRKAKAAAASANAPEPEVEYSEGTPSLYNDPAVTATLARVAKRVLGEKNVELGKPSMGGEDFSRYGKAGVPICMFRLGSINADRLAELTQGGAAPPSLHSPRYYPDAEGTLRTGVAVMSAAAIELLKP